MGRFAACAALAGCVTAVIPFGTAAAHEDAPPRSSVTCLDSLAATYSVRRMEMGGGIMLRRDGSFLYELAYGALDEIAQGHWTCNEAAVILTTDAIDAPRFVTLGIGLAARGALHVHLKLPDGLSQQFFSVLIRKSDGSAERVDFRDGGLTIDFPPDAIPVSIQPLLDVYGLAGEPVALPAQDGFDVTFAFQPNDLGKVAFSGTPLTVGRDGLMLDRFGEKIWFQRVSADPFP